MRFTLVVSNSKHLISFLSNFTFYKWCVTKVVHCMFSLILFFTINAHLIEPNIFNSKLQVVSFSAKPLDSKQRNLYKHFIRKHLVFWKIMYLKLNSHVITEITSDIPSSFLVFCKIESCDDNLFKSVYVILWSFHVFRFDKIWSRDLHTKSLQASFVYVISDFCSFEIQTSTLIYLLINTFSLNITGLSLQFRW